MQIYEQTGHLFLLQPIFLPQILDIHIFYGNEADSVEKTCEKVRKMLVFEIHTWLNLKFEKKTNIKRCQSIRK